MPEPPRQIPVGPRQGGDERTGKPNETDEDAEIGAAPGEQDGMECPQCEQAVEGETDDEHCDRRQAGRLGHGGDKAWQHERGEAEGEDSDIGTDRSVR